MKKETKLVFSALGYVVLFVLLQLASVQLVFLCYAFALSKSFTEVNVAMQQGLLPQASQIILIGSLLSNTITLAVFYGFKYTPLSSSYLKTKPYKTLFFSVLLALSFIIPLEGLYQQTTLDMPEHMKQLFASLSSSALGFLVLGILAPIAEEFVFRGAILRTLLNYFQGNKVWIAVVVSSAIFALVHGNNIQIVNAFIMGLVLSMLYLRTKSVLPGVAFHITNNSVAFLLFHLGGKKVDATIQDVLGNNTLLYNFAFAISIVLIFYSTFILYKKLK